MPDDAEKSQMGDGGTLQVGAWTAEFALNQLSAAGKRVRIEPKSMALLRYLAERPGQVVSRDALLAALWPGVVVGDDSLTQAIIKLRKALGDTAESPSYIQTIPKSGYRLVAAVTSRVTAPPASAQGDSLAPGNRQGWRTRHAAAWGLTALLLAAAGIWWLDDDPTAAPVLSAMADAEATRAAQPAIRIAPFEALGRDAQAVLLARGITADLVTDLSKVFGLSLIADTALADASTASPAQQSTPIRYLVSGSVQRIEDRVRLHVHLADAQTGKQLWSERFEGAVGSMFALQDELVPKLLQILPAKVSEAELRRVAAHHTRNLEAYEYYQRGQMALAARQQEENEVARDMFRHAIALDASFALAYAALAQTYAADHRNQWTQNRAAALERASELARTAHQINSDVRETYWVLAFVHLERGEHKQALEQIENVIRLYPSYADAYALMGGIHAYMGQPAQTLPLLRTAIRLKPEAGYLYFLILGRAYFALGDLEQARLNLEHAVIRNPVNLEARVYAAAAYVAAGDRGRAQWEAEEIRALQPVFSAKTWLATHPLRDAKTESRLVQSLSALGF